MERIAFYAPMKSPDHPVPSGERETARLFAQALAVAGYDVELACRLRSREPDGDPERQARLERAGGWIAKRLVRAFRQRPASERPIAWFTYHLYYKAMDWIGPIVARELCIPYLAAEVSVAPRRAEGPWRHSHEALLEAIAAADVVFPLTDVNRVCMPPGTRQADLAPFLDPAPFQAARAQREAERLALTARLALDPDRPWIAVAAMMRFGVKTQSFALLAEALGRKDLPPFHLLIAGDGPAEAEVQAGFASLPAGTVHFLGRLDRPQLAALFAASDLYAWPAVKEAFGVAFLEAQSAGLPVVAGNDGGVADVVGDGESGLLVPPRDAAAFADGAACLLRDDALRARLSAGATARIAAHHSLERAAQTLRQTIEAARDKRGA